MNIATTTRTSLFFFNDTATTEIYTLSLHDALPISLGLLAHELVHLERRLARAAAVAGPDRDRKSTRLNSSHLVISYAVFCLKKKNTSYAAVLTMSSSSCRSVATQFKTIIQRSSAII